MMDKHLTAGNIYDASKCIVLMVFYFDTSSHHLRAIVIAIYWVRLLEAFSVSEKIMARWYPIQKSYRGLGPALCVTFFFACALIHALYAFRSWPSPFWPDTLFNCFNVLINGEFPPDMLKKSWVGEMLLIYFSVLVFMIFVLNVFIGIISE